MVVSGEGEDRRLTRKECSAGIYRCPVFWLIWFCFLLFEGVISLLLFPFLSFCFVFQCLFFAVRIKSQALKVLEKYATS